MAKAIFCRDSIPYLEAEAPPCSIVMSPPVASEAGMELEAWASWYEAACFLAFRTLAPGAPCVIYSTDQKSGGRWISSPELMQAAARRAGVRQLWHKVVLRRDVGGVDIHRPGFSHLCAFGDDAARPGQATTDVMSRGASLYRNGMGMIPARLAVEFAARPGLPLLDPFCGRGTVPAIAEALGFEAIGIDLDPAQCEAARKLQLRATAHG